MPVNKGKNQRPSSAGASQHPVTFSDNPPQSSVPAALAAGQKQVDAAKQK